MKKFLAILVLGLLWCNVGIAETKTVTWQIYSKAVPLAGSSYDPDANLGLSFNIKRSSKVSATHDQQNFFNKTVQEAINDCDRKKSGTWANAFTCVITVIKYSEENNPSNNKKIVDASGINTNNIKVDWNGIGEAIAKKPEEDSIEGVSVADGLIKIPVHVHIFKTNTKIVFNNKEYDYKTIATPKMVIKDFSEVNEIWKQANIEWNIVKIDEIFFNNENFKKASKSLLDLDREKLSLDSNKKQLEFMKKYKENEEFREDLAKRREKISQQWDKIIDYKNNNKPKAINAYYIPYMLENTCGIATLNSSSTFTNNFYLVVGSKSISWLDKGAIRKAGQCMAHELGHILSLEHRGTRGKDLMVYWDEKGRWGKNIPSNQISQTRNFYKKNLKKILE